MRDGVDENAVRVNPLDTSRISEIRCPSSTSRGLTTSYDSASSKNSESGPTSRNVALLISMPSSAVICPRQTVPS